MVAREEKEFELAASGRKMEQRAAGITDQLDHAIYDDDPDAADQLKERITRLESQQTDHKERNAAYEHEAATGETARYLGQTRYAGECRDCHQPIEKGSQARYYRKASEIACYPACA